MTEASPRGPRLLWLSPPPFYPDAAGGSDRNYVYLFDALRARGWQIEAVCGLSPLSSLAKGLPRGRFVRDDRLGYPCWRGLPTRMHASCRVRWAFNAAVRVAGVAGRRNVLRGCGDPLGPVFCRAQDDGLRAWFEERLRAFRPDVVLGHFGVTDVLSDAAGRGYPSFYWIQGMRALRRGIVYPDNVHVIANSPAVADLAARASAREVGVVVSFMPRADYEVAARTRRYVTFVNPIPEKGLPVAIEIARQLPQERFLFVKGGWFDFNDALISRLRLRPLASLPNVEVWDFQEDMRRVYGVTDILLVPSKRDESFGRVIVEAQISGIPVIAANDGGIPWALGNGGVLIDPGDDAAAYVRAIQHMRADESWYAKLSDLALQNSRRPEFDPERQVDAFVDFVTSRLPDRRSRP